MRHLVLTILIAPSLCIGQFTSPPWPIGTNYYTAGSNKDWRAEQCSQAILERETVMGVTNWYATNLQFYAYEHANLVKLKSWAYTYAHDFVDLTRSTNTNIEYWTVSNLLVACGLPTNYIDYTPWQQLNGVGYPYTNSATQSGYSTLDYGYAGMTSIFKRLTAIARGVDWIARTNDGLWGRGWAYWEHSDAACHFYIGLGNQAKKHDWYYETGWGSNIKLYPLWTDPVDAIAKALSFTTVEWEYNTNTMVHTISQFVDIGDGDIWTCTNHPPSAAASMLRMLPNFLSANPGYSADWFAIAPMARYILPSSDYACGWKLYVAANGASESHVPGGPDTQLNDWCPGDDVQFSDMGAQNIYQYLYVNHTGMLSSGSTIISKQVGVTSLVAKAESFPTIDLGSENQFITDVYAYHGNVDAQDVGPSASGGAAWYAQNATRGFEVSEAIFLLDFGITNGLRYK